MIQFKHEKIWIFKFKNNAKLKFMKILYSEYKDTYN